MALAIGSIAAGNGRQSDEGWQAHLWQLLMVAELPIIAAFAYTADWDRPRRAIIMLVPYAVGIGAALAPVSLAGL